MQKIEILHFFLGNLDAEIIAYFHISMLRNKMEPQYAKYYFHILNIREDRYYLY